VDVIAGRDGSYRKAGDESVTAFITILAPEGLPNITDETDLVAELLFSFKGMHAPDGTTSLVDGDILVISSKAVAKSEGRRALESERLKVIAEETQEVIAEKESTQIVRNKHGLVLAAAGVDASNTEPGTIVLLPANPDDSAARIRKKLQDELGVTIGVIISDTLGRPWRLGLTDAVIGSSGVLVLEDHRGRVDSYGRTLELTEVALGDEIAAAADLLKSKAAQRPVAVVRGLGHLVGDHVDQDATTLVRPIEEDLFVLGTKEARRMGARDALKARRTVREFDKSPLDQLALAHVLSDAVAAAITAPAPHHSSPWRFVLVSTETKQQLLKVMESRWRQDLAEIDGLDSDQIQKRISRGRLLHDAPCLVVPCLSRHEAHAYPDTRRSSAEWDMFTLSGGAAIENFLVYLAAQGWASAWVSSSIFCASDVCEVLQIPSDWQPLGVIAVGKPAATPTPREPRDVENFIVRR
jgi:coenzyme F420-0:L-glutamate ligase/coenzyme F420-1:gamma-L-glutamate ligase